jgi:hypothetical protein
VVGSVAVVVCEVSEEDSHKRVVAEIYLIRNCTPTITVLNNRAPLMAAVARDTMATPDMGVLLILKGNRVNRSWYAT